MLLDSGKLDNGEVMINSRYKLITKTGDSDDGDEEQVFGDQRQAKQTTARVKLRSLIRQPSKASVASHFTKLN